MANDGRTCDKPETYPTLAFDGSDVIPDGIEALDPVILYRTACVRIAALEKRWQQVFAGND